MEKTRIYRQGDVMLREISREQMPENYEKNEDNVLARGEITGHNHVINGAKVLKSGQQLYVVVEQEAELVHEEHGRIAVPKGVFQVVHQREYNPRENRRVMD